MKTIAISGSPWQIGLQLGEFGRHAWQHKLTQTTLWQRVMALKSSPQALTMRDAVAAQFPAIWQELEGMAAGLQVPVEEVFAWNCRGDLVPSTSDGCTTVAGVIAPGRVLIAHNEDGFPQLRDDCALVSVTPEQGAAFTSFAYPGSLCGHTFAVNQFGIVNTVNNIRAVHRPAGLPRQILARASLNATTLEQAIAVLTAEPRAGAFHHTLGQLGDGRLYSVEATGSGSSVVELAAVSGHANHLIHPQLAAVEQVVTGSSASRQQRLMQWQQEELAGGFSAAAAQAILSDTCDALLPIYRLAADDPDEENTLATAVFVIGATSVEWQVFTLDRSRAASAGQVGRNE